AEVAPGRQRRTAAGPGRGGEAQAGGDDHPRPRHQRQEQVSRCRVSRVEREARKEKAARISGRLFHGCDPARAGRVAAWPDQRSIRTPMLTLLYFWLLSPKRPL